MTNNIIKPVLIHLDRFLIGSLLSMGALAYYSAPYEVVTRLQIIPASLTVVLFPAFSALEGIKDRQKVAVLFVRSIKYILLLLGPIIITLAVFAKEVIELWLGSEFAGQSASVLRILAYGVLINSLAYVPATLLNSTGRPDIPVKIYMFELPLYFGLAWFFIRLWGIEGAAWAWSTRVAIDAIMMFGAAFSVYHFSLRLLMVNGIMLAAIVLAGFTGILYGMKNFFGSLPIAAQVAMLGSVVYIYAWLCWKKLVDSSDRSAIYNAMVIWRK